MSSVLNEQSVLFSSSVSKRTIATFTSYVTISEESLDELEITQHPVQRGAAITDHAYLKPSTVTINFIYGPGLTPFAQIYQNLLDLQASIGLFDIVTGKRAYKNMLLKSLRVPTDAESENILYVSASFQQVDIVDITTTVVPVREKQQMPEKTDSTENKGDKKAEPVESSSIDESSLSSLFGGG